MTLVATREDGIRIVQIRRPEDAAPFRASFAGAYQDIFSEPPYNERFSLDEAEGVLTGFLQIPDNITLLALKGEETVVAFGIGIPASARADVARELRGLIPVAHSYYLAELGTLDGWRGRGLGRQLVQLRLALIDQRRYSHVVLRTSAVRNSSYEMYLGMGFDDTGVYMEVPSRRVDGMVTTDRRLFLARVLTPEDAQV